MKKRHLYRSYAEVTADHPAYRAARRRQTDKAEDAWAVRAAFWFWRGLEPLDIRSARARRQLEDEDT